MPRPSNKKKIVFVLIFIALVGYYAYIRFVPHAAPADAGMAAGAGAASPVSVAEVIERDVQKWNEFSGRLVAVDEVEVRPRVSGTIESVHFKNGDMVKKNQVLFVIDPRPYVAAMQAARAKADLTASDLARAEKLRVDKAIPAREYDQRKNDAEAAKAELTQARLNLEYTELRSPIAGKAGRAEITEGNLVDSGGSAPILTTVVSNTPIYADFEVDEDTFLNAIHSDNGVKDTRKIPVMMGLATEDGTPHKGHIDAFDNRLNIGSGTIRVRAVFDNANGALLPGLFARVKLGNTNDTKAILVTDRAIGTDQSKKFVYVVGADNKVVYREVKLGPLADGLRIVLSGLKPGEKIIVNGLQRAHPGAAITPETVAMEDKNSENGNQKPEEKK